jgi:hypothetical protein
MNLFTWNPGAQRESLDEFNTRVQGFCLEDGAAICKVDCGLVGNQIVLSLLDADDVPFETQGMAVMPVVFLIRDPASVTLEDEVNEVVAAIKAAHSEDDPRIPVGFQVLTTADNKRAYLVITVMVGEVSAADDSGEDDEQVKEAERV